MNSNLIGAEDVRRAGHEISAAAGSMRTAANQMDASLTRHREFLDDWLNRLEQVLKENLAP